MSWGSRGERERGHREEGMGSGLGRVRGSEEGDGEKVLKFLCLLVIAPFHGLVAGPNAPPGLLQVPCIILLKMPLILSCTII